MQVCAVANLSLVYGILHDYMGCTAETCGTAISDPHTDHFNAGRADLNSDLRFFIVLTLRLDSCVGGSAQVALVIGSIEWELSCIPAIDTTCHVLDWHVT